MRVSWIAAAFLALGQPAYGQALTSLTDRSDILGWEAVGRLDIGEQGGNCSGALISPHLVLTAAHCLFHGGDRLDPTTVTFHAGYRDGDTIATKRVARAVVHEKHDPLDKGSARYLEHDVALLELEAAIPATTASPFAVARAGDRGMKVTVVSFGASRMNAASRQSGCELVELFQRDLMAFDCAGEPGSSGAPIFDMSGHAPRIVSMVSSGGPYDGRPVIFGMDLSGIVGDLKAALRSGRGVWPVETLPEAERLAIAPGSARPAGGARFVRP